ncbi:hypothetical protein, conserved [Babesia ovata]|uniref:Uncharacterized protein n=1 Tax=Babesia ovata TaxID=189622 RepID=A0A2H6KFI4_9APIC|nr:uncharacterized protein BOVATA_032430 [Babesia ovata]GBE61750.1 hypothetical protein, conserved [Babesia ovata]
MILHNKRHSRHLREYSKQLPITQGDGNQSSNSHDDGKRLSKTQNDGNQSPNSQDGKMVYKSLTDAPRNIKECMDWLIALRGKDGEKNLKAFGEAIYKFLAYKPVGKMEVPALEDVKRISKQFMEQKELKDLLPIDWVLRKFSDRIDKTSIFYRYFGAVTKSECDNVIQTKGITADDIAKDLVKVVDSCDKFLKHMKIPDQYKSAYSSKATWAKSCALDPESCAVVLVGIAPMLYAGLSAFFSAWRYAFFRCPPFIAYNRMREMLKALGFVEPECRASPRTSDVYSALSRLKDHELYTVYDLSGFWAFY